MTTSDEIRMAGPRLAIRVVELIKRAVRANPDLNQKDIAGRLGVNESRLSQIVNGDGNIQIATLARVLAATGYEVEIQAKDSNGTVLEIQPRRRRAPQVEHSEPASAESTPAPKSERRPAVRPVLRADACWHLDMNVAVGEWSNALLKHPDFVLPRGVEVRYFDGHPPRSNLEHIAKRNRRVTASTDEYAIELIDA